MAANSRTITVLEGVGRVGFRRHHNSVEGGQATTATLAQVSVELERATKEVGLEVLGGVERLYRRQVHSVVEVESELSVRGGKFGPVLRVLGIKSLLLAVHLYLDGWVGEILGLRDSGYARCGEDEILHLRIYYYKQE